MKTVNRGFISITPTQLFIAWALKYSNEEQFFTEKVERLNGFIAPYSFTEKDAHKNLIREIPFWRNGYISLGSANGLTKMNHEVLMTWSEILKKIPKNKTPL